MSGQNPMRSGIRAKPGALAPHALDFASRLTEILPPGERDALRRALQQITDRSTQLVAEAVEQNGATGNVRDM
jgi:hypothetical protein